MLKCGFLMYTCFCCGACGCTEGTAPCRGRRGSWASPQRWGSSLGTAGVWWVLKGVPELLISHCLPAPCQAWPGIMRLWVCIALLSVVLCASADRPAFLQGIARGGQFVRDAARGKLLLPGALPSGTPSPRTGYQQSVVQPSELGNHSSILETPLVSAAGRGP